MRLKPKIEFLRIYWGKSVPKSSQNTSDVTFGVLQVQKHNCKRNLCFFSFFFSKNMKRAPKIIILSKMLKIWNLTIFPTIFHYFPKYAYNLTDSQIKVLKGYSGFHKIFLNKFEIIKLQYFSTRVVLSNKRNTCE